MPTMLRTIVGDLLRQEPDMLLVAPAAGGHDAIRSAREDRADILITQDGAGEPGSCLETILGGEGIGICALSADGRSASAINLVRRAIGLDDDRFVLADAVHSIAEDLRARGAGAGPFGRTVSGTEDRP